MKFKLFLLIFAFIKCPRLVKSADLFDDQPKILVNDGNLVFESADSKNVTVRLKGHSFFLINGIDILRGLRPNGPTDHQLPSDTAKIKLLEAELNRFRSLLNGKNGILSRLDRLELGIPANATLPSGGFERSRLNNLNRRITVLEQRVANLTERLMKDHCKSYPCQNGGTCFNMFDTFRCECTDSWEGPTCSVDTNECAKFVGTDLGCQNGATCINTQGSYECRCTGQWKGQHCTRQKMDCSSVPQSEICGHGTCVQANNKFGFDCICEQGWRKSNDTQSCTVDIDECTEMRPHCSIDPKVMCVNTPGSFVCGQCPAGYSGNGFSCVDIDECEVNNGGCSVSPLVECKNRRGSFKCGNCPVGYAGDGRTCTPTGIRPNLQCADSSICNENALCVQYPSSAPTCTCKAGYSGNGYGPQGCTFVGIDACSALSCQNGGTCMKNGTSAYCVCPRGTSPPFCERNIDPCASNPCLNGGTCTSRFGRRYSCNCVTGFVGPNCINQVRKCGGVRNAENGTIRYPESQVDKYAHNSRCAWLIKTNASKVLNITFTRFDLEPSRDCKFDWLQIHDGRSSSSHMIGRFCGTSKPKNGLIEGNIVSTHNMLYLWFRSDNSTSHDGFELTYESVDPVCGGELNITTHGTISSPGSPGNYPMNRDCIWTITAPPSKRIQFLFYTLMIESHETCAFDYVEIHSGHEIESPSLGKYCNTTSPPPLITPSHTASIHFHSDGDSSDAGFQIAFSVVEGIPGCGGIYTSAKGDITSPTNIADGKYKHNMVCDYQIQMPTDSRVRLEFKKFALESSSSCKFDKLEIFEGNSYDEEQLIGRYCGSNMPPVITSQSNTITVKFTSDWSSNDEGFQFQYQLVCGGVFSEDNGNISSPNYPNPYAGERTCEYDIAAPLGKTIILTIADLDMEMHSNCDFDNLEIFDGVSADNATSLGRFCGQTKPPSDFVSSFNHLRVHFTSDSSVNGRGFTANYSFVDVECGGIVKNASEIIKSPMDTDENGVYKPNLKCRWLVFAPIGHVIQMNFLNFELEKDSVCKYDFVKIFNNGTGKGEAMGPFCGVNAPKVVTTLDHIAMIQFQTDSSNAKEGFTISLAFIDANKLCGAHYFSSQGILRSPGQPEYLPNKECEWVVTAPQNQQIEITFKYFEMETHAECRFDKLEIRNGGNSFAPLIGRFCGETVPAPIRSFSNQLFFKFSSDSSRAGKGFEIEWDATSSGCGGRISTTKGSISSPNYPESYSHNAQCEWQISVNEGSTIEIIFTDLDLESHSECKYDYLEIFDGTDASSRSFGKFCSADNHPMHLETAGNHAMMRLNTDDSQSGRGFFLKYSIKCNRTIRADSGVIESPNFPHDYPHNSDCAWTIIVSKGNKISYQFSHFHLENDNQFHNVTNDHICKYDYVEITSKDSEDRTQLKNTYCNSAPAPKISNGNEMTIVFHSDASATGTGFRMEWYVEGCGGHLTHPQGTLTSPNYPSKYSHQLTCIWEITVEFGYKIEITINDLEMESSAGCEYDYLALADDRNFNSSFGHICSSQSKPQVFTSHGHKMFVMFNSDDSNNGKGFNLTYTSKLLDCGGKFVSSSGMISSPGYLDGHNYGNNLICDWMISTDKSHSLVLELLAFDLVKSDNCTKDYVEVLDPIYNRTLWKGCDQMPNITSFKSERNELIVRLVTDGTENAHGFKANFSNSCGGRIVTQDSGDFEFRFTRDSKECQWAIISEDPAKKIVLTFTYVNIFLETIEGCLSRVEVFEGDSDKGPLKKTFCGSKTPPAIFSNGNALTVKLNSTSLSFVSEFDVHYSVVDNACGGEYKMSMIGEFASPDYPRSTPLNTYCIWKIGASEGHKMSLSFSKFNVLQTENCNENYVEIRKTDQNGELVGVFCGDELPPNIEASQSYWIKYKTGGESTSSGFVGLYKYAKHSNLEGASGKIESPNYPKFMVIASTQTYRITVKHGSVIRIEFPHFFMDEEDEDECFAFLRFYNGYDETAPQINGEICSDNPEPIVTEANIIFIEFINNHMSKTKFQLTWKEVDKVQNLTGLVDSECGDKIIFLKNETEAVNITSPGYPDGYGTGLNCTWTIMSGIPHLHPVVVFKDIDLEDLEGCVGDYVMISSDREDGSWKQVDKQCTFDLRDRKMYDGTPNIMLQFKTDYGVNRTGFYAYTYLECGGKLTDSEGIIQYSSPMIFRGTRMNTECKWNITVRRGKTIKFEFLEMNLKNDSNGCQSFVTIRNGIDDSSPFLGGGQYCGLKLPTVPVSASNRAFVKFKPQIPISPSFKLRYSEVQHECGGQIRLSRQNNSRIITTPNYPSIPNPHIECLWTVLAPVGERIRIDFIDRFDLWSDKDCSKEYVELRDGSTRASPMIGTYCTSKPTTKRSKSNVLLMKFFTNTEDPKNGFKANISIDVCGGTIRSNSGYLTSTNYPGVGAYPNKAQCEYRITGSPTQIFNITVTDVDLPPLNDTKCDLNRDHLVIYSVIPDFNATSTENLIEIATLCGNTPPDASYLSDTNEVLIKFNTFDKTKDLFRGFKLFYNASRMPCGGEIEGETGIITSPGYPTKTLSKLLCEWKITVPKGRRVKIEFLDVDLLLSNSQFLQRIGVYNDFRYSNRIVFISGNNSALQPVYSSDNRMMITIWVRISSNNRGFKLRYSSDTRTICEGGLNDEEGAIFPPIGQNLTSYSCDYYRDLKPIYGDWGSGGTIAYYFRQVSVGKKLMNCRYASTVVNVKRRSGLAEEDQMLARICGNTTSSITVASPFPDINIEVRQNPFFGPINFTMFYKTHKCGGTIIEANNVKLTNLPANTSREAVLDCAWFLRYEEGFSVAITIPTMNMKLSCDEEFINIYNGPTALAPLIGKYCGNSVPNEPMVSQGNTIFVEYHTSNFVGSSKDSLFKVNFNSASFGCGGILNKNNFNFKTPQYGKTYPLNTECVWEVRADPGYHVGLTFIDRFYIEDSANCTKDYVEVFDMIENDWVSLGKKCGREVPKPFNSTSEKMRIIFRSDSNVTADGFSAVWNQNCGGIYRADTTKRVLSSPGFPKAYGPNLLCNYTFVAPPKGYINMNFLEFAVETTGTKCIYDNVTIWKVPDYAAFPYQIPMEKLGTFCGMTGPSNIRQRDVITVIFQSDRWVERKGFSLEYQVEECGGVVTSPSMIQSPKILTSTAYLGSMSCTWNITAPVGKKIIVKFENFTMETSNYCSFDFVELYNGTKVNESARLAKICGNLTNSLQPIVIENNEVVLLMKTDQTNADIGFSAAISFRPLCDQKIELSSLNPTFVLDKSNQKHAENMDCVYKVSGEALGAIRMVFNSVHLPRRNDSSDGSCDYNFVEVHDGNGPFSPLIGKYCGHEIPHDVVSSSSAMYIRYSADAWITDTGFKATFSIIESPCGSQPYRNFTGNETSPIKIEFPQLSNGKYPPNTRCAWELDAPYGKIFDLRFANFDLEDSPNCENDSLTIEDDNIKDYVTEGLGQEVIFRGKNQATYQPSFYSGISGPTAPHVYCGSVLPHDYISESKKIKIRFVSNSVNEFKGFTLFAKTMSSCGRNFTALTGRIVSTDDILDCKTTIKVPANHTISLFFHRFFFYEQDCTKSFLKVYDGTFENGALLNSFCGYAMPDPIFSTTNQLSLFFHFDDGTQYYMKGNFDIMYVATDKGRGCGGTIYNYGGIFTSPLYPSNNRSIYDCTWTITVPQNLKVAIRFPVFDMGSKLLCEQDYVEFLEENEQGENTSIKKFCGEDDPAVFVSSKSTLTVHHAQTQNFAGTGWNINFMGVKEGSKPQNW